MVFLGPGADQNGGDFSYTSCCSQAIVSSGYTSQQNRRCHLLLFPLSSPLCGRAFGPPLCGGTPPATPPLLHATLASRRRCTVCATCRPPTSCRETRRRDHGRGRPCACPRSPQNWTAPLAASELKAKRANASYRGTAFRSGTQEWTASHWDKATASSIAESFKCDSGKVGVSAACPDFRHLRATVTYEESLIH